VWVTTHFIWNIGSAFAMAACLRRSRFIRSLKKKILEQKTREINLKYYVLQGDNFSIGDVLTKSSWLAKTHNILDLSFKNLWSNLFDNALNDFCIFCIIYIAHMKTSCKTNQWEQFKQWFHTIWMCCVMARVGFLWIILFRRFFQISHLCLFSLAILLFSCVFQNFISQMKNNINNDSINFLKQKLKSFC